MKNFFIRIFTLLFSSFVILGCSSQTQQIGPNKSEKHEEFVIAGSGSNIAVTRKLVEAFQKKQSMKIEVPDSIGSGGAITGVLQGKIDLGLTSRSLALNEKASGLIEIPYAISGLSVAVGPDVPDENVTYDDLVSIYKGDKKTWSNGETIIVFLMYEKDSTNEVLIKEIPGFKEVLIDSLKNNRWQIFYNQQSQEEAIAKTPHSIGFVTMPALMDSRLKALTVNKVKASPENMLNDSYKLYKTLNYIYKEPLQKEMKDVINFTFSKQGKQIIIDYDCIPVGQ
ncbi:substrate-binding domain-containing protein [Pelosinus sp. sgz500959]|uniref:substrate-binding domain-containing protein n=1 Tax=Pelosinus sp. sgz500959 TaxID=3242472 RepID=UPI00366B839A